MEKTPLSSKKFLAFFVSLAIIAGILVTALILQPFTWSMAGFMSIGVTGLCALCIGYVISQKSLDAFMRGLPKGQFNNDEDSDNME